MKEFILYIADCLGVTTFILFWKGVLNANYYIDFIIGILTCVSLTCTIVYRIYKTRLVKKEHDLLKLKQINKNLQ